MRNKITVVIAAYNAANTICRAIDSVLSQQCDIEVIVVDDCSNDSTQHKIKQYVDRYAAVKLLTTAKNAGPSVARNLGIDASSSDWIAILDADDWFAPNRLSSLLNCALTHELDFVADSYYLAKDENSQPYSTRLTDLCSKGSVHKINAADFIQQGLGSIKPLVKKALLDKHALRFIPSVRRGEDLLLYATLLMHKAKFGLLNTPLYFRSEPPNSLSRANKTAFLKALQGVLLTLQAQANRLAPTDQSLPKAINYRLGVTKDALAAAKWRDWLQQADNKLFPPILSLLSATRHLLLRKKRYHLADVCHRAC